MGGHGRGNTLGHTCRMDCVVAGVFTVSGAPKGMKWDNEGWFAISANFVISTGAKRSGEICGSLLSIIANLSASLS